MPKYEKFKTLKMFIGITFPLLNNNHLKFNRLRQHRSEIYTCHDEVFYLGSHSLKSDCQMH